MCHWVVTTSTSGRMRCRWLQRTGAGQLAEPTQATVVDALSLASHCLRSLLVEVLDRCHLSAAARDPPQVGNPDDITIGQSVPSNRCSVTNRAAPQVGHAVLQVKGDSSQSKSEEHRCGKSISVQCSCKASCGRCTEVPGAAGAGAAAVCGVRAGGHRRPVAQRGERHPVQPCASLAPCCD